MPSVTPARPGGLAHAGRAAHDLGLAGLLGGQLFGRLALHPAVEGISDPYERGEVVNAAWKRYGAVNGLALLTVTAAHVSSRVTGDAPTRTAAERALTRAKDGLIAATFLTGLATAATGVRFSRQAPDGRVPLEDGDHAAAEATERQARTKRLLNRLGVAAISTEAALVVVNAALDTERTRRGPLARLRSA